MRKILLSLLASLLCPVAFGQQTTLAHNSILRSGPSSGSKRLDHLTAGTAVTIISRYANSGYVRIQTADQGETGWVLQINVKKAAPTEAPQGPQPGGAPTASTGATAGDPQIYPNAQMTPGQPDPSVTQSNIARNICNKSWSTDSVRPADSVTSKIKTQTMAAYGFTDAANHYELDHLISLQVGGCPDCVENLWPEAYGDRGHPMTQVERAAWNKQNPGSSAILPGSLEKDVVENHVHDEICFGIPNAKMSSYAKKYPPTVSVTLQRGQQILATEWYGCYVNIMNGNKPCE